MNKELHEKFTIKYGFTPEAVLSMTNEKIDNMSEQELDNYIQALLDLQDKKFPPKSIPTIDGVVHVKSEEDWPW